MFWFFKRKKNPAPGSLVQEEWKESFPMLKKSRFGKEAGADYTVDISPRGLFLELNKKNVFAWCSNEQNYRYADFHSECTFVFDTPDAYCAAGIMFRRGNDYNYYYFLVSNKGYFRVDCIFNSNPIHLIDWTGLADPPGRDVRLGVTGWGSYYIFYADGKEIARLNDDTIENGSITFCAQNYDSTDRASILLNKFSVNSKTFDVEKTYQAESEIPDLQRKNLAKSFFERGKFMPAAVQMKALLKKLGDNAGAEETGFYGEILLNLGMYEEALNAFNRAVEKDPEYKPFLLEKGNILYQMGRYDELDRYLDSIEAEFTDNPVFCSLKGHSSFFLRNFDLAGLWYQKAAVIDKDNPWYSLNTARSYEKSGMPDKAVEYYSDSCVSFYRLENYEEAMDIISLFDNKKIKNRQTESVKGKILFNENRLDEAGKVFKSLIDSAGEEDAESDILFLYGLILFRRGKSVKAVKYLKEACGAEQDCFIYWFKLAEIQYSAGMDAGEALKHSFVLEPENCWVNNLAGKIFLDAGNIREAEKYFHKAYTLNSSEEIIAVNYSESLLLSGKTEKALEILDIPDMDSPGKDLLKQKGRILSFTGNTEEAEAVLQKAVSASPDDMSAVIELSRLYYNLEDYRNAWDLLSSIQEQITDPDVFNMLGNMARIQGDFVKAEDYYLESLKLKKDPVVILNYAEGLCEKFDYKRAGEIIGMLDNFEKIDSKSMERAEMLKQRIFSMTEKIVKCDSCGKEWHVPKDVRVKRNLKIRGDLSPDSPAGRCQGCGKIYCVGCASERVEDGRFLCIDCGERLKLSDDYLLYLVMKIESLNT